jgi:2-polyprenyl-3-methyl-5-hydroxy-6-metoxy-1,4-benzoquinol methylase
MINQPQQSCCHICGTSGLIEETAFSTLPGVTSDARPWHAGSQLAYCPSCDLSVKILDDAWHRDIEEIYRSYAINHQSGGSEKLAFDRAASPRSTILFETLLEAHSLPQGAEILDIGTGNGALLRAVSHMRPDIGLWGQDVSGHMAGELALIPGFRGLLNKPLHELNRQFSLITLVHVLEHVEDPISFLKEVSRLIAANGALLLSVPDSKANPFDYLTVDHCTHFTLNGLENVLRKAGYQIVCSSATLLERELVIVARPASGGQESARHDVTGNLNARSRDFAKLIEGTRRLSERKQMAIFGASLNGVWLASTLPDWHGSFVDQDPNRIGRKLLGHPIISPAEVPAGTSVLVPLAQPLAERIAKAQTTDKIEYLPYLKVCGA